MNIQWNQSKQNKVISSYNFLKTCCLLIFLRIYYKQCNNQIITLFETEKINCTKFIVTASISLLFVLFKEHQ